MNSVTRDGRYHAKFRGVLKPSQEDIFLFSPMPNWKYISELKKYNVFDFGVITRLGKNCNADPTSLIIPTFIGPSNKTLRVTINSQRALRTNLSISQPNGEKRSAVCEPLDRSIRSTAFNILCKVELDETITGKTMLSVTRRLRSGITRTHSIPVYLP